MASSSSYGPERFVEYRGRLYRALSDDGAPMITLCVDEGEPAPEGLGPDPRGRSGCHPVDPRSVTSWYSSSWTFRWKGELFSSGGVRNGRINGYYQGAKGAAFADAYLVRTGAIEYEGTFPLEDVTDLTETRYDLLARWKADHPE
ncbi:hypothetical protein [Streptacidiphilus cavernicola]|uniref:Uncharacterized protein n=1 Tax=Streptacidiphilus cavernicola TaxID=3342716 RepID=A0ABV6VZI5_9ACTN